LLAAGWFAGLVEALVRKPNVKDFESLGEDVMSVKGFWKNKVTKVLLVVILANIGSTIGTVVGGAEVLRLFFRNL
jgi:pheromone shutdown protein TraB